MYAQLGKIVLLAKLRASTSGKYVSITEKNSWYRQVTLFHYREKEFLLTKIRVSTNKSYVCTNGKNTFTVKALFPLLRV